MEAPSTSTVTVILRGGGVSSVPRQVKLSGYLQMLRHQASRSWPVLVVAALDTEESVPRPKVEKKVRTFTHRLGDVIGTTNDLRWRGVDPKVWVIDSTRAHEKGMRS